jgi:hypothetical protein
MSRVFVYNEEALVHTTRDTVKLPGYTKIGILAWPKRLLVSQGPTIVADDDLRPATQQDFDRFKVHSTGCILEKSN